MTAYELNLYMAVNLTCTSLNVEVVCMPIVSVYDIAEYEFYL